MQLIPLSEIEVRKRQRSEVPAAHKKELRASILQVGLLHPIVCWQDGPKWVLSAGECRFRTIEEMAAEKIPFRHGGTDVPLGSIPVTPLSENLKEIAFEAELDENVRRLDLSWQDKARAYSDLHTMRLAANPQQTLAETKAELVSMNAPSLHSGQPMKTANRNAAEIREAQVIAENLHDDKVAQARNPREALQYIYRRDEAKIQAVILQRTAADAIKNSSIKLIHGGMEDHLPQIAAGSVDLVFADPPYGVAANTGGFRQRSAVHHNYEDTPEIARDLLLLILTEGWRITKPMANILVFGNINTFPLFKTMAGKLGWVPFDRPLTWVKSESEGMAPWGGSGPRITTEHIFYATKGQRGMRVSPVDVLDVRRVARNERVHGAQKPVELLKQLIDCCTMPGDLVVDPCCGTASTLKACQELKRSAIGIEKDQDYYTQAFAALYGDQNGKE